MRFCELACDALTSWDQLSAEAKRITAQIHQFISDNNHQPVAIALHHDELT
jgi:hypothetical protein